jgi:hypothetical protein
LSYSRFDFLFFPGAKRERPCRRDGSLSWRISCFIHVLRPHHEVKEPDIPTQELSFRRKKPKGFPPKTEDGSLFNQLGGMGFKALKNILRLGERAEHSLEKYKKEFQRWLTRTTLSVLSFFMCMVFLALGLFFIAMDYGHLPRGIVFLGGGLLGFLILRLLTPAAK